MVMLHPRQEIRRHRVGQPYAIRRQKELKALAVHSSGVHDQDDWLATPSTNLPSRFHVLGKVDMVPRSLPEAFCHDRGKKSFDRAVVQNFGRLSLLQF